MKEEKRLETNELISVVIPMYNTEKYIKDCLESICRQTYPFWECIVVDDGSCDGSCQIVTEMTKVDGRIRLLQIPHQGVSYAVKAGVLEAKGQWIYFADSDDWIDEDELAVLYGHVQTHGCDMVAANYIIEKEKAKKILLVRFDGFVRRADYSKKLFSHLLCKDNSGSFVCGNTRSGKLIKKELLIQNLDYQIGMRFGEDAVLVLAALLECQGVVGDQDHYGYHYRAHENSSSANYGSAAVRLRMEYVLAVKALLEEKMVFDDPVLQDNYRQFLLINLLGILKRVQFDEKKLYHRYPEMEPFVHDTLNEILESRNQSMKVGSGIVLWMLKYKMYMALRLLYQIKHLWGYGWRPKVHKKTY